MWSAKGHGAGSRIQTALQKMLSEKDTKPRFMKHIWKELSGPNPSANRAVLSRLQITDSYWPAAAQFHWALAEGNSGVRYFHETLLDILTGNPMACFDIPWHTALTAWISSVVLTDTTTHSGRKECVWMNPSPGFLLPAHKASGYWKCIARIKIPWEK